MVYPQKLNTDLPGILTIALGGDKYTRLARNLVRSIRWHSPRMPIAVITDRPDSFAVENVEVIATEIKDSDFLGLKLRLSEFTPFSRTIFIDADCLATRSIETLWTEFHRAAVTVWGWKVDDGIWYSAIKPWRERYGLSYIAQHNSGVILFDNSEAARWVFSRAYELHRRNDIQFPDVHGLKSDEPALGVALAEAGIEPIDDGGRLTRTPIALAGELDIDVLKGRCICTSYGKRAEPAIFHFTGWMRHAVYCREVLCLRVATSTVPRVLKWPAVRGIRFYYLLRRATGSLVRALSRRRADEDEPTEIYDTKVIEYLASVAPKKATTAHGVRQ